MPRAAHKSNTSPLRRRRVEKRVGKALRKYVDKATGKKKNPVVIPPGVSEAVGNYVGYQITGSGVAPVERFLRKTAKINPKRKAKRNPAQQAIEGYEEFHGKPPDEFVTVTREVHFHRHLSGAGQLRRLVILAIDGKHVVTLTRFKGALLAFNERKNQLFIEGGDTSVNLADFGIDPREAHELETLGKVKLLDYFTDKKHLGDEGGAAIYRHKLRTTNEDGRHITVRIARYPDAIYRVRDKYIEFSGGSYQIIAEGIDR